MNTIFLKQNKNLKYIIMKENNTTLPEKVWLTKEYDNIPEGSCIHVKGKSKTHYKGTWASMGGSYSVTVPKNLCRETSTLQEPLKHVGRKKEKKPDVKYGVVWFISPSDPRWYHEEHNISPSKSEEMPDILKAKIKEFEGLYGKHPEDLVWHQLSR